MTPRAVSCAASAASLVLVGLGWTPVRAACDTTAAALAGFFLVPFPSAIDTTLAPKTVTCWANTTDELSGVTDMLCTLTSPDGFYHHSCNAPQPKVGNGQQGTWICDITLPRYSPSGDWTASAFLPDYAGNQINATIDPSLQGLDYLVTVTSDPDLLTPELAGFTLSTAAIDVSAAAQDVTCEMELTDDKSGVDFVFCNLFAPIASSTQSAFCIATAPLSGTRNNGLFACTVSIPRFSDAGTWMADVVPVDQVGNFPALPIITAATLAVNSVPEDIVGPSMPFFGISPLNIAVGSHPEFVRCLITAADAGVGVDSVSCMFSFIEATGLLDIFQTQSCTARAPLQGTRNLGDFSCDVLFPQYAAGGSTAWTVSVDLVDLVGNTSHIQPPDTLFVDCAAGDAEISFYFETTNTPSFFWRSVSGATQYNVYRGPLTNLTDANTDHLPDGGYGSCQNWRRSDVTTTYFTDPDIPSIAQKGFFYLVSYTSGGVEKGLGVNSLGTPRTESSPCP